MTRNTSSDEMETKSTKELFALAREKMTTRTSSGINGGGDDNDGSFFLREAIEMFAEVFRRCDSAGCFDDDSNHGCLYHGNICGVNRIGGENVSNG